jgi:[phosphatase 2A protein]-leucine-carboxy methyltransferase
MIPTLWTDLTDALVRGLKVSSPEKSQGYRESQNAVCAQASRFFDLESEVLNNSTTPLEVLLLTFTEATTRLLLASIDVLRSRNGKPYGAAAMIAEAVTKVPQILEVMDFLDDFLVRDIPELVLSPSADHLVSVLFQCRDRPGFQDGLKKVLDKLSETGEETQSILGVSKLFSSVKVEDMKAHAKIQSLAFSRLHRGLEGDRDAWADVIVLLRNPASRRTAAPRIISSITDALSANDGKELDALDGLNRIVTESKEPIRAFSTGPDGSKLIARLLYLAESPVDEIAALADSVQAIIRDLMNADGSTDSAIEIIDQSFQSVRPTSLS